MKGELSDKKDDSDIEKARFCAINIVWIRNRKQNIVKVGTATATNHYGSTTLLLTVFLFQI
jgi:hypothetical protein